MVRVKREYPGAFGQSALESQGEAVSVYDADLPGHCGSVEALIAGEEGMLHRHALVDGNLSIVYENFDPLLHNNPSRGQFLMMILFGRAAGTGEFFRMYSTTASRSDCSVEMFRPCLNTSNRSPPVARKSFVATR